MGGNVVRPIVPVKIKNKENGHSKIVYALLDTGSDCDMIDENIVKDLDIQTTDQIIEMHVVENITTKKRSIASFSLQSTKNAFESTMENVIVGKIHPAPGEVAPGWREWNYSHFRNINFDKFHTDLGMIIGAAHVHLWIPAKDVRIGKKSEPIAIETPFGWNVLGLRRRGKRLPRHLQRNRFKGVKC